MKHAYLVNRLQKVIGASLIVEGRQWTALSGTSRRTVTWTDEDGVAVSVKCSQPDAHDDLPEGMYYGYFTSSAAEAARYLSN